MTLFSNSFAASNALFPIKLTDPWMIYFGVFSGYNTANFSYGTNYSSTQLGGSHQSLANDAFQQGILDGGQFGIQYHFNSLYFIGVAFSAASNAEKAYLAQALDDLVVPEVDAADAGFVINHQFRVNYNIDFTGSIGADVTAQTHVYGKLGGSYSRIIHQLFTTQGATYPFSLPFLQNTQHLYRWAWVIGLGFTHDVSKWMSIFAEYNHYRYGNQNLNALDENISPVTSVAGAREHLTQHVGITANSVRLGLNVKFMDHFAAIHDWVTNPWIIYLGGFGGYYSADFRYGANYFGNRPTNQVFNNDTFQQGILGGVQLGIQYHFHSPYFVGMVFGGESHANKARLTQLSENTQGSPDFVTFDINHQFRINYHLDMAAQIGADVTPWTHLYAKLGAAYAQLTHFLFITRDRNIPFPIPVIQNTQHRYLWGWLFGMGMMYDLNRWFNIFAEYDRTGYGARELNTLNGIAPALAGGTQRDHFTQHVTINSNVVKVGLNLKLMDTFSVRRYWAAIDPWVIYMGAFGGYYSADFYYGGNYFSNTAVADQGGNQTFNNDVFQQGISGGGELSIQYHFNKPYFIGMAFSTASHANKAHLINLVENAITQGNRNFDIDHQFQVNYNFDLSGLIGADLTTRTHLYGKVGSSYARLTHQLLLAIGPTFPFSSPFLQSTQHEYAWGWVTGFGFTYDMNRWVSGFAECDHYRYAARNLNALDNIGPGNGDSRRDRLTQYFAITADSIKVGFNVKFPI